MENISTHPEQLPARMLAGALSHLATHMETGCPRAAYLAAMLLEQVASDTKADCHLRQHARELFEILEHDPVNAPSNDAAAALHPVSAAHRPSAGRGAV